MRCLLLFLALTVLPCAARTAENPLSKLTAQDVCITEQVSVSAAEDVPNLFLLAAAETLWAVTYKYKEKVSFSGRICLVQSRVQMVTVPVKKGMTYRVTLELVRGEQLIWSSRTEGKANDFSDFESVMPQQIEINYQKLVRDWQATHPEPDNQ